MARKRFRKLALIVALCLPLSGCWDSLDINDRDIATAVIVDKTDYGYSFTVEIPPIAQNASLSNGPANPIIDVVLKAEGRTYSEARDNIDLQLDKPIYLGAVQTIILTDRLSSSGIDEYLVRLRQTDEYRKTAELIVTTEDPVYLLSRMSENSSSIGFAVHDTLQSMENAGHLFRVSLADLLEMSSSPYRHYILPTVALTNGEPAFTGFTIFSGGIKIGFIPLTETRPIIYTMAKNASMTWAIPYNNTHATVLVNAKEKKIVPSFDAGGTVHAVMHLEFQATLLYPEDLGPLTTDEMNLIQGKLETTIAGDFIQLFQNSKQIYHYDVYNIHEYFQAQYPEEFKRMNWADEYEKLNIDFYVKVKLKPSTSVDYNPKNKE